MTRVDTHAVKRAVKRLVRRVAERVGRRPARPRGGFTMVEVLLVSAVLSILARIAIPNVDHVLTRARAADAMGDVSVVRVAAYGYLADHHTWPPDAPAGTVPEELEAYLPDDFSFRHDGYTLDWESWTLPDGLPGDPDLTTLTGVTVVPGSAALADALLGLVGRSPWFIIGDSYTFLIEPG